MIEGLIDDIDGDTLWVRLITEDGKEYIAEMDRSVFPSEQHKDLERGILFTITDESPPAVSVRYRTPEEMDALPDKLARARAEADELWERFRPLVD